MTTFNCCLINPDIEQNPDIQKYKKYFCEYSPELWSGGNHGGLFETVIDNLKYSLVILENASYGIMVSYGIWDLNLNRACGHSYYSLSDESLIHKIEDVGDDEFSPIGCFVKPTEAWLAVEDFFNDPTKKSDRIEWVNSEDIPWPEDW